MRRRFTLIEMLVVVAIIAILAAMLSPSLQKALGQARSLYCGNNLKNYSRGMMLYAGEHDDMTPPNLYLNATGNGYEGTRGKWYQNEEFHQLSGVTYDPGEPQNIGRQHACPLSWAYRHPPYAETRPAYAYVSTGASYGRNSEPNTESAWLSNMPRAIRLGRLRAPADKLDMMDALTAIPLFRQADPAPYFAEGEEECESNQRNKVAYRHYGRANAVFYDGHLKAIVANEIWNNASERAAKRERHWVFGNAYLNP